MRVRTLASLTVGPEVGGFGLGAGAVLSGTGDGLEMGMDYLRRDYDAANNKLFLFAGSQALSYLTGQGRLMAPSEAQKIDVLGEAINTGSSLIKDQVKPGTGPNILPRKATKIANSLNVLKSL